MFLRWACFLAVAVAEPSVRFEGVWCDKDCCKGIAECAAPDSYEAFNNCGAKLPQGCIAKLNTTISIPQEDVCFGSAGDAVGFKTGSIANYEWQPGYAFTIQSAGSDPADCDYELKIGKLANLENCPDLPTPISTVTAKGHSSSSGVEMSLDSSDTLPIIPRLADYWRFKTITGGCAITASGTPTVALGATLTATGSTSQSTAARGATSAMIGLLFFAVVSGC